MAVFVFANNVNTTLASPITTNTQTTITLSSTANLPTIPTGDVWALTLNDAATQSVYEIVYVTARTGAVLTVERGQEGTAATTWLANDFAFGAVTAGALTAFPNGNNVVTGITAGYGIELTGTSSDPEITNTGVVEVNGLSGNLGLESTDGSVSITNPAGAYINFEVPLGRIGDTMFASVRLAAATATVELPYSIPGGTWRLYARAEQQLTGSNTATLTGSSGSWESPSTSPFNAGYTELIGTATTGQTPSVTLTFGGSGFGTYSGILYLQAVRTS